MLVAFINVIILHVQCLLMALLFIIISESRDDKSLLDWSLTCLATSSDVSFRCLLNSFHLYSLDVMDAVLVANVHLLCTYTILLFGVAIKHLQIWLLLTTIIENLLLIVAHI